MLGIELNTFLSWFGITKGPWIRADNGHDYTIISSEERTDDYDAKEYGGKIVCKVPSSNDMRAITWLPELLLTASDVVVSLGPWVSAAMDDPKVCSEYKEALCKLYILERYIRFALGVNHDKLEQVLHKSSPKVEKRYLPLEKMMYWLVENGWYLAEGSDTGNFTDGKGNWFYHYMWVHCGRVVGYRQKAVEQMYNPLWQEEVVVNG